MQTDIRDRNYSPKKAPLKKAKTSLRKRYEEQVEKIKKDFGNLEEIRQRLGLSQRKLCQLLLVDPSAWSRWTKKNQDAPPHIYRALAWYLSLQEKYPGLGNDFWLSSISHGSSLSDARTRDYRTLRKAMNEEIQNKLKLQSESQYEILRLKKQLEKMQFEIADLNRQRNSRISPLWLGVGFICLILIQFLAQFFL